MAKKKKVTVSTVKKKLDAVYSRYIRLKDSFMVDGELNCTCVTCGATSPVKKMQCGHFMSRKYNATRFHAKNTHVQCLRCNMFDQGAQYEHYKFIDKKYGEGSSEEICTLSRQEKKWKVQELEEMLAYYKVKVSQLEPDAS